MTRPPDAPRPAIPIHPDDTAIRSQVDRPAIRTGTHGRKVSAFRALAVLACLLAVLPWASAQTFVVLTDASQASYAVQEKVAGVPLPRDAIGTTRALSGRVVLGSDGAVADGSEIRVDLTGLTSDSGRRDRYVASRTLGTGQYPEAVLRVTTIEGLPSPVPEGGTRSLTILGDLTVRDVTRPVRWEATAAFTPDGVTVDATTSFTFDDFGLTRPVVGPILAVSDPIRLTVSVALQRRP